MSIEALKWALETGEALELDPPKRHILLVLANRADEVGYVYPSVRWMMKRTGYAERTVRDHMKDMIASRLIGKEERRREDGGQTSNLYRLALEQPGLPLEAPPAPNAPGGARHPAPNNRGEGRVAHQPPARGAPQENKEEKKEQKGSAAERRTRLSADFKINERVRKWYATKGYPPGTLIDLHFEAFIRKVKANGSKYVDWDEALMNAIADDWGEVRRSWLRANGQSVEATHATSEWWKSWPGVLAKAKELGVERRDLVPQPGQRDFVEGEQNLWFKARVFAAAGEGPWCEGKDSAFLGFLRVAREQMAKQPA